MQYYIVDAFTEKLFGGNPAGVVLLDNDFPPDRLMQQVAAELRYSETAFVRQDGADEFTVRYFTPRSEVDLCGHATIATFGLLWQLGKVGDWVCLNHTLAGDLEVMAGERVMMQMATPKMVGAVEDVERLCRIMQCVVPLMPVEIISTGLPDIILPVQSQEELAALNPDMAALAELSRELEVVGVHAFVQAGDGYTAHVRDFAPLYGVPEESATGTANASLAYYLQQCGCLGKEAECSFIQGEAMGRPSVVETSLLDDGTIWAGGNISVIATGTLLA